MKKKNWKYLTVILLMVGVTMMILSFSSVATTVPMERSVTSIPVGYSEMVELKNMGKISHLSTSFTGSLDQSQEKLTHGYYIGIIWPDGGSSR